MGGRKIEPPRLFVWLGGASIVPPSHAGADSIPQIARSCSRCRFGHEPPAGHALDCPETRPLEGGRTLSAGLREPTLARVAIRLQPGWHGTTEPAPTLCAKPLVEVRGRAPDAGRLRESGGRGALERIRRLEASGGKKERKEGP